ncbi:MAG: hypothetical protein RMY36_031925 [Nostoc sp. SerVER01]|uniref:hypothetical protein n=1 Tax=Nostoc sp. CCY 9925 TaxID=3103865 RepID=UPI002ADB13CB|nr:hypothetical protein [Nostoc sp. SerVER01]MDZ8025926.1 hypothetical protein [Nostoc sp. DedQUE11]MDZ8075377.1 hypothetical protein [Nostoc sp. DedQUE01]MDZ8082611.1 hypothetical protein [Nostoc sp. DcaGUA01]
MKLIKKFLAFCFLLFGIPLSAVMLWDIINPKTTNKDKQDAVAALAIFTVPSTMIGGWLSWSLVQQNKKEKALLLESEQKRLQLVFLELVESNSGTITVLQMAKNSEISTEKAKEYLDEKAKELNASFEVSENGNILYRFS